MSEFGDFLKSLFGSWLVWAGAVMRLIPFFEALVEEPLRKIKRIDEFISKHAHLKRDLKRLALLFLFIGCYRAWVFEHKNAENAMYGKDGKAEAWSRFNECDKDRAVKQVLVDQLHSQISGQESQLGNQQDTFNKCILALSSASKPERLVTQAYFIGALYADLKNNPNHVGSWIVATNRTITPVRLLVRCDGTIVNASGKILGTGASMSGGWGGKFSDHKIGVGILSPAWTPMNPMLVTISSKDVNMGTCDFTEE